MTDSVPTPSFVSEPPPQTLPPNTVSPTVSKMSEPLFLKRVFAAKVAVRSNPFTVVAPYSEVPPPKVTMEPEIVMPSVAVRATLRGLLEFAAEIVAPVRMSIAPSVLRLKVRAAPPKFRMCAAPPASALPVSTIAPVPVAAFDVEIDTSVVTKLALISASVMSPLPDVVEMVSPVGSISQLPVFPCGAWVSTLTPSATRTREAEVSTNPPSPPSAPPRALMLPLISARLAGLSKLAIRLTEPPAPAAGPSTRMLPLCWMVSDASSTTRPATLAMPVASSVPLLRTTPPCNAAAACAERMICPPGATTALRLSTKDWICDGVTSTPAKLWLSSNRSVTRSPAAMATAPICADTKPWLRTSGAIKAT